MSLFEKLHGFISPFVRRKWRGPKFTSSSLKRKFCGIPKCMGPATKLPSKDEFLLLLMRLRLGLLIPDLAQIFSISSTLTGRIIATWLRASAQVLGTLVFVPGQGTMIATKPPHFYSAKNLHSIIDATEIFIQTPKNHVRQRQTWSNYKHHNTMKILIAVAANSTIIFVSKAFGGSISDKELTSQSKFLDTLEPYTSLMADKGFGITEECAARRIMLIIPPGRRGQSQMLTRDVQKTNSIAKMRILVEQVIRQLKCFRILATEVPINVISQLDDIVIVCSALTNMFQPIYR